MSKSNLHAAAIRLNSSMSPWGLAATSHRWIALRFGFFVEHPREDRGAFPVHWLGSASPWRRGGIGRRDGFKIRFSQESAGSTPAAATTGLYSSIAQ
jgi:hypothetical protein